MTLRMQDKLSNSPVNVAASSRRGAQTGYWVGRRLQAHVSGVAFARVLDRLGIAEAIKAKTILVPGVQAAGVVAKGDAELGIGRASELVPSAGVQLVAAPP